MEKNSFLDKHFDQIARTHLLKFISHFALNLVNIKIIRCHNFKRNSAQNRLWELYKIVVGFNFIIARENKLY